MDEEDWEEQMMEIKKRHDVYLKESSKRAREKYAISFLISSFITVVIQFIDVSNRSYLLLAPY